MQFPPKFFNNKTQQKIFKITCPLVTEVRVELRFDHLCNPVMKTQKLYTCTNDSKKTNCLNFI